MISFNLLVEKISGVIDKHAPLQTQSRKQKRLQQNPWLTKALMTSIKNKQKNAQNSFLHGDEFQRSFYKKYANIANNLIRVKNLSKRLYNHESISSRKNNPKDLWKFLSLIVSSEYVVSSSSTKINVDSQVISDPKIVSEHFSDDFVKIGHSIAERVSNQNNSDF